MKHIMIAIPSGDDWKALTSQCVANLVGATTAKMGPNLALGLMNNRASMITGSRNDIVQAALNLNADAILWIDSDMTFPPNALMRLLSYEHKIVGAIYNKRVPPYETLGKLINPDPSKPPPTTGVVPAEFMPGGFMLISADVYRKLGYPWYFESYFPEGGPFESWLATQRLQSFVPPPTELEAEWNKNSALRTWLEAEYAERKRVTGDAKTMSEDYNFCRRARARGFKIFCDLDLSYQMGHIGTQVVTTLQQQAPVEDGHFYQSIDGWFGAEDLYRQAVADAHDGAVFVEIGTWKGKSAAFMAVEIKKSGKNITFYTIDTFKGSEEMAHKNDPDVRSGRLQEVARRNLRPVSDIVRVVESDSVGAASSFADGTVDFVFIDGAHSYEQVIADITAWRPKLRAGGILAGDDFNWPGVAKAVKEAVENFETDGRVWKVAA